MERDSRLRGLVSSSLNRINFVDMNQTLDRFTSEAYLAAGP